MGQTVELEAAMASLPPAIEAMNQLIDTRLPQVCETIREGAKASGAKKVTDAAETIIAWIEGYKKNMREVTGTDGDKATQATLCGLFASAKQMDTQFNG